MLIPTWILLLVWTFAAWLTVTGYLVNDVVQPALAGGLVLIVLLIGFTVMQHAFAGGVVRQGPIGDTERRALALTGAGDIVWDWDVQRDRIYAGPEAEDLLGLQRGALEGPARDWLEFLHPGRPRPLQDPARRHRRAAPRTDRPGFPAPLGGRPLSLVPPPRPAGARLRRRGASAPSARSSTSPRSGPPRSASSTTRSTTTSPAFPTASSISTGSRPRSPAPRRKARRGPRCSCSTSTASSRSTRASASPSATRSCSPSPAG